MNFDIMDKKMRQFEQSLDQTIMPHIYLVTRLDGRSFTKLTKERCHFEAPFDERFRDYMIETVKHLMNCGFRIVYGYTESDEISLLFHPEGESFGNKIRKLNSILAGEASGAFSLQIGQVASFDCRIVPLPNIELVKDYFLWRQEDSHRNSLNAHCYWLLRREGKSPAEASKQLEGKSIAYKNELLHSKGINYDTLPSWQKKGTGIYWEEYQKEGINPKTNQMEIANRRRIRVDMELPLGESYADLIQQLLFTVRT